MGSAKWNAAGGAVELPRGNPLADPLDLRSGEAELFADAPDGRLHRISLVDAALVACGADDLTTIEDARRRIAAARNDLKQLMAMRATALNGREDVNGLQRVELVHRVLHQRLLTGGYNANATNLAATFNTGVYNCASATLLFVALAADLRIDVQAIELPGHVRAMVDCDDQQYEVEVTCPVWRDSILRVDDAAGRGEMNEAAVSESAARSGRPISTLGLVAMIYYNRGIDAFNERRFGDAIAANRRALLLDPDNKIARGNLMAAANNWALALCDAGYFAEAERLLADGRQFDPGHLAFVHNAAHVQRMWDQVRARIGVE
jgi:tetratricopeptide (TPR) repeat protein